MFLSAMDSANRVNGFTVFFAVSKEEDDDDDESSEDFVGEKD
jgi:hypothetical protein